MLILSRRQDDQILFPTLGVRVHVLRVGGGKVRIGVEAPPDVKVLRHELEPSHLSFKGKPADQRRRSRRCADAADEVATTAIGRLRRISEQGPVRDEVVHEVCQELKSIEQHELASKGGPAPPRCHDRRTALLVDDNNNESKLLAGYLRLRRFDVAIANDGAAAIDYLSQNEEPDVVLLDMQMPVMDGPTAINRLRSQKRFSGLKVFAVSGGDPADYGVEVSPKGVNAWFPKPLDPEALVVRLALEDDRRKESVSGP